MMTKLLRTTLAAALIWVAAALPALAQTAPGWTFGFVPSVAQWNAVFAAKQDYLGAPPLLTTGGTMIGKLVTAAPNSAAAAFRLQPGSAPSAPLDGDLWATSSSLFVRINGVTTDLIGAPCATCAVTNATNVFTASQTISLNAGALPAAVAGSLLRAAQADGVLSRIAVEGYGAQARFTAAVALGTAAAPTQVTSGTDIGGINAFAWGSNAAWNGPIASIRMYAAENITATAWGSKLCLSTTPVTTIVLADGLCQNNDRGVTLGSPTGGSKGADTLNAVGLYINGTAVSLTASNLTVGTSAINSGTTTRVLFNNGAVLGEYAISGTGSVAMTASPTFTGTANFANINATATIISSSASANALTAGPSGATSPSFNVDASTASAVTGLNVKSAASGGGLALSVISSATNENLTLDAKGSGSVTINGTGTGNIGLQRNVILGSASQAGSLIFVNVTSGAITINPPTGALGGATWTLQIGNDTFVGRATTDPMTNKTITSGTNSLGAVTMAVGSDATGDIYYRDGGGHLARLPVGANGTALELVAGLPSWQAVSGTGTVTNVAGGYGITGGPITTTGTLAVSLTTASNILGADVNLNNTANYFDGPSMAQGGTGTWWADGTVTLLDASSASYMCKLWDGTTVISSAEISAAAAFITSVSLHGSLASPAGNIRISCKDINNTTGKILFNQTGNSKDSSIFGHRIQ